jgi:hypothetical protein
MMKPGKQMAEPTVLHGTWEEIALYAEALKGRRLTVIVNGPPEGDDGKAPREPRYMFFGMFRGEGAITDEDFKEAEFHGDPDDGLDWPE